MLKSFNVILILILCFSCNNATDKKTAPIIGHYFKLEKDNIEILLPKVFKQISHKEYVSAIKNNPTLLNKEERIKIANVQQFSNGNIYHFKDEESTTEIDVKTLPYSDFNKEDSTYLLAMLNNNCQNNENPFGTTCKKVSAGFSGNSQTKVFKAVFKVTYGSSTSYNNMYVISSNYKTFSMIIKSALNTNYDNYIQKIRVK